MSVLEKIGQDIDRATRILEGGGLVAIPTETVYGLGGLASRAEAVARIFEAKRRPRFNPLILHVPSVKAARALTGDWPDQAEALAAEFWPGPLTLVLPRHDSVLELVTAGSPYVAVRIPRHPMTLELLARLSAPLAAPSANPSGYVSPSCAEHVAAQLGNELDYILDGGPCEVGLESSIVKLADGQATVLRAGGLAVEELQRVLPELQVQTGSSSSPEAPGMLASHYAPRARVVISPEPATGRRIGALRWRELHPDIPSENQELLSSRGDLREAAQRLFGALRRLDDAQLDSIQVELVPEHGLGRAINDRLRRAAAPRGSEESARR